MKPEFRSKSTGRESDDEWPHVISDKSNWEGSKDKKVSNESMARFRLVVGNENLRCDYGWVAIEMWGLVQVPFIPKG